MNKNILLGYVFYIFTFLFIISFNNWFTLWIILELNSFTFLLIIIRKFKTNNIETTISFFIIQSVSRLFLILFMRIRNLFINIIRIITLRAINVILIFKIGIAPFQNWFIPIAFQRKWAVLWLLLILQKLPYFLLIYYFLRWAPIIYLVIILNILIRSLSNLKQNTVKMILIFSRLRQIRWIIARLLNLFIWETFFLIYGVFTFFTLFIFEYTKKNKKNTVFSLILFRSIRGIPPFLIFYPKIIIINSLILIKMFLVSIMFILFNLVDIYVYSQYVIIRLTLKKKIIKWIKENKFFWFYIISIMFPILLL